MKITAIIEKGADGMFSVRSDQKIGNHYFGGFGESVEIAKVDFLESVQEVIEEAKWKFRRKVTPFFSYERDPLFRLKVIPWS